MTCHGRERRSRAFSLIEAVLVVILLAVSVPPALTMLEHGGASRAELVNVARATTLAAGVLEHVEADCYAGDGSPGFAALAASDLYLNAPGTGLRARLAWLSAPYEAAGLTYDVEISGLVGPLGVPTGDPDQDRFRRVDVVVRFRAGSGSSTELGVSTMVTELEP